jgi:hypothetical protein
LSNGHEESLEESKSGLEDKKFSIVVCGQSSSRLSRSMMPPANDE